MPGMKPCFAHEGRRHMTTLTLQHDSDETSGHLTIEVTSTDPLIGRMLDEIDRRDTDDPVRSDCQGMLLMALARDSFQVSEEMALAADMVG
jgi:hypothetical protein